MLRRTLIRRPAGQSPLVGEALNHFFGSDWTDDVFRLFGDAAPAGAVWAPAVDLSETEDAYRVVVDLPGLTKDEVEISLEDNLLTLSGERRQATESGPGGTQRSERWHGRFSRAFTLPGQANAANVKASFENGVLTIVLPKLAEARRRRIEIQ